jgi:acetyl-CoA C-acetyltransferase
VNGRSSGPTVAVLVGASRTPFDRFGGVLRDVPLGELAAVSISSAIERAGLEPADITELALGVNFPGSDRSVARQASLHAGLPETVVSYTVDRACCSSLAALDAAWRAVRLNPTEIVAAGGVENMSRVPYFLEGLRWGHRLGPVTLEDQLVISCPYTHTPRATQASDEALIYGIGRVAQDEWAERSQQRWQEASSVGLFSAEIAVVTGADCVTLETDQCPRPGTTLTKLAGLAPVNGSATVTAGNAPAMATGSTALVVTSAAEAARRGIAPMARILAVEAVSGPPANIASIPAVAARKVLTRAGLGLSDIDLIEINEAFAAVPLVTLSLLADGDGGALRELTARTNVNGGAIAVGHPTGATAARLVMTLVASLRRRGGGRGLVTICGGIGEAHAVVLEVSGDLS